MRCQKCGSLDVFILFNTIECKICDKNITVINVAVTNIDERIDIMKTLSCLSFSIKNEIYKSNKSVRTSIARLTHQQEHFFGKLYNVELWDENLVGWKSCTDIQLVDIIQLIDRLKHE